MVNKRGVTLLELVVVMAVVSILAAILPKVFLQLTRQITATTLEVKAQSNLMVAKRNIEVLLKDALASTVTIKTDPNQPVYSRIEFKTFTGKDVAIYQSNQALYNKVDDRTTAVMKDGLQRLAFAYPNIHVESQILVTVSVINSEAGRGLKPMTSSSQLYTLDFK